MAKQSDMERESLKSIVESLLFVADEPVTVQRLGEAIESADRSEISSVLRDLKTELDVGDKGIRLVEVAGGFQLRTAKENADWVKKFLGGRPPRMSRATLETLAIIAYKQPITRAEIEAIRGVDVDGVLSTLMERRLIRPVARKDVPGRPFLYGTTPGFLETFNLKDLTHLPTLKEMEDIAMPELPTEEALEEKVEE